MPVSIRLDGGGARRTPSFTTKILLAAPSVRKPSRSITVSAQPAVVDRADGTDTGSLLRRRGSHQRLRKHEHGRRHIGWKGMVTQRLSFGRRAARHLNVDRLVGKILLRDQLQDALTPLAHAVRVGQADAVEAELQATQVRVEPEGLPRIHRDQFVDAVTKDKATVEHRHLRLGERQELSVQVDAQFANSSRIETQTRPNRPATPTSSRATSG